MTKNRNFFFTYYITQVTFFLAIDQITSAEFTKDQKNAIYQNCTIFNDPNIYGGKICGTDGSTYSNSFYLDCINYQYGTYVDTWHKGACRPDAQYCNHNLVYTPVCGTDNRTWSNFESLQCYARTSSSNIRMKSHGECESRDYCSRNGFDAYGINPVCGSNGYTYQNVAQIKCLQQFNNNLKILHDGGCFVTTVAELYKMNDTICQIARNRYEWNPLCATDDKTYMNPFVFLCYTPELGVRSNTECDTPSHQACVTARTGLILVNGEYVNNVPSAMEPVCGNDGQTYQSEYHVLCHSINNKYLYTKHRGPCFGSDDNPCSAIPEEKQRFPICGSNGISYVSPEALWCAKRRNNDTKLAYKYDGPC